MKGGGDERVVYERDEANSAVRIRQVEITKLHLEAESNCRSANDLAGLAGPNGGIKFPQPPLGMWRLGAFVCHQCVLLPRCEVARASREGERSKAQRVLGSRGEFSMGDRFRVTPVTQRNFGSRQREDR